MNNKNDMNRHGLMTCLVAGLTALSACSSEDKSSTPHEPTPAIDFTAMDQSVSPKEDFYRYANGGWMASNPLKDEYGLYGTFNILRDTALNSSRAIIEEMSQATTGTDAAKAYKLYSLAMDMEQRNAQGAEPLKPYLQEILALENSEQLVDWLADIANHGQFFFFVPYVGADEQNSDVNLLSLYQTQLIMDDQSYYEEKEELKPIQDAYLTYATKLMELSDIPNAEEVAKTAYAKEKELSNIMYSRLELRDVEANYNKMSLSEAVGRLSFPLDKYFAQREGLTEVKELNMSQIGYFEKLDKWLQKTPLEEVKAYLLVALADNAAPYLSEDFVNASFDFHGRMIGGLKEDRPQWKKAVSLVNGSLGDVVGKAYVQTYFPPEAKARMTTLVENLRISLGERIQSLEWMSDATKAKAAEKLETFHVKIGYPDEGEWVTYEKLDDSKGTSLYDMMLEVSRFEIARNSADLGQPVDRNRWLMNAHEVNAYYNPTTNEICFPAGILQPPFFNLNADDAVNYGGIGTVIGHEMTHGFDDQGRKYDKYGNMADWWTEEDAQQFNAKAKGLADQYSQIEVKEGLQANGDLTLGENIADQGGLLVAYNAMKKATNYCTEEIDGLTPDQRFFIAYGRLWGQNIRPEEIVRRTKVDVHSLGEYRVNQAIRNIPAFYEAFDVQEGDAMYLAPEKRVLVW